MKKQIPLELLVNTANSLLQPEKYTDYCPNGLQVQGTRNITRLVTGVTASLAFIEAALADDADALLVHHGCFWKGDPLELTGMKAERIRQLMRSGVSLLAYHLPLDAHPELGNNAILGRQLGFEITGELEPENPQNIGFAGVLKKPLNGAQLSRHIAEVLGREPLHIGSAQAQIKTIAWCSGGAQSYLRHAIALGVDAYLTGEISEQNTHEARENGLHYFAAGHHATERGGAQAVGAYLATQLGIEHQFIDIDNPA